jgi:hypothetical protein
MGAAGGRGRVLLDVVPEVTQRCPLNGQVRPREEFGLGNSEGIDPEPVGGVLQRHRKNLDASRSVQADRERSGYLGDRLTDRV